MRSSGIGAPVVTFELTCLRMAACHAKFSSIWDGASTKSWRKPELSVSYGAVVSKAAMLCPNSWKKVTTSR